MPALSMQSHAGTLCLARFLLSDNAWTHPLLVAMAPLWFFPNPTTRMTTSQPHLLITVVLWHSPCPQKLAPPDLLLKQNHPSIRLPSWQKRLHSPVPMFAAHVVLFHFGTSPALSCLQSWPITP